MSGTEGHSLLQSFRCQIRSSRWTPNIWRTSTYLYFHCIRPCQDKLYRLQDRFVPWHAPEVVEICAEITVALVVNSGILDELRCIISLYSLLSKAGGWGFTNSQSIGLFMFLFKSSIKVKSGFGSFTGILFIESHAGAGKIRIPHLYFSSWLLSSVQEFSLPFSLYKIVFVKI